jgi:glycine cleavage system H protein
VTAGEPCGEVESVSAVNDLYAPVDGEVIAVNEALEDNPGLINTNPWRAWMFLVRVAVGSDGEAAMPPDLLSMAEYEELTRNLG